MRPFTHRVEVPIPNWGHAGGSDPSGEQISASDRRVQLSVYYNALSVGEFRRRNRIPRNQCHIDRLRVPIPNCGLISNSDNRVESYTRLSEEASVCDRIDGSRPRSRRGILSRTGNLRMRPFTNRVEVPILNWVLAGGSDTRANRFLRPIEGYGCRCTITHALGRNFRAETEFRETSGLSTVSECRFRIVVTFAILMPGREVIHSSLAEGVGIN
ncbi:hypothetical protein Taro_042218 [Colocasia esculenta]|uniref:Uncharacterized protein n=1 Tax=Colocasia esculenta TaxID=4460 RepID=A0A843WHV0_COLES|nr:hypothetical protein [Colocasia esculenta]